MLVQHDEVEPFDDFLDDPEEAVNLYELLGVTPDADTKRIRKRVGEMFLEAQNNVEHRNFRRRFYYRELMETVLPRARHHLLDVDRREDYDRSLGILPPLPPPPQFIPPAPTQKPPTEVAPPAPSEPLTKPTTAENIEPIAPFVTTPVTTTVSGAPSDSVVLSPPALSPPTFSRPALSPPALSPASSDEEEIDFSKFAPVVATDISTSSTGNPDASQSIDSSEATASETTGASSYVQRGGAPAHSRMDAARVERRRDEKRRELIKQELMAAGTKWAALAGGGTLIAAGAVLFGLGSVLEVDFLKILAVPIGLGAAAVCGYLAHRAARKRIIILLSQMPYDQLLRRCAKM